MFGTSKPLASLSSGLLARKGQARPAMRPQGFSGFSSPANALDDLGWNDMGQPADEPEPAAASVAEAEVTVPPPAPAELPPVLQQREALKEELETAAEPVAVEPEPVAVAFEPAAVAPAPIPVEAVAQISREAQRKGKSAFTLRLDSPRHLRLRLASAMRHRSAQALVTDALDQFLSAIPELEELARQCPSHSAAVVQKGK